MKKKKEKDFKELKEKYQKEKAYNEKLNKLLAYKEGKNETTINLFSLLQININ